MSALVSCQLILQAADSSLPPNNAPASGVYPNRILTYVPSELSPLVVSGSVQHTIATYTASACQALANQRLQGMGTGWAAETNYYSSGSIEQSGEWATGSGYSFRILKYGAAYQKPLDSVATGCKCTYLLSIDKLADLP